MTRVTVVKVCAYRNSVRYTSPTCTIERKTYTKAPKYAIKFTYHYEALPDGFRAYLECRINEEVVDPLTVSHIIELCKNFIDNDGSVNFKAIVDFYNKTEALPEPIDLEEVNEYHLVQALLARMPSDCDFEFKAKHMGGDYPRDIIEIVIE